MIEYVLCRSHYFFSIIFLSTYFQIEDFSILNIFFRVALIKKDVKFMLQNVKFMLVLYFNISSNLSLTKCTVILHTLNKTRSYKSLAESVNVVIIII